MNSIKENLKWGKIVPLQNGQFEHSKAYDLDLLPKELSAASIEVARFTKVPAESVALIGISCLATAIGKKAVVVEREGLEHYPSLFVVVIASSGERKSPIMSYMKKPIDNWVSSKMIEHERKNEQIKTENLMNDMRKKNTESAIKKEGNKKDPNADMANELENDLREYISREQKMPPSPSMYTTNATEEKLFQLMHERGEEYAVLTGEGRDAIEQISGKYTAGVGNGDALYLAGITGDTVTRDRVGKGDEGGEERIMFKPCLNVGIMVQPDKYAELAGSKSLRASGAIARILSIQPESLVGTRMEEKGEKGLDIFCMEKYENIIKQLLNTDVHTDDNEVIKPHKALLSIGAAESRRIYHNKIERLMQDNNEFEDVRDIASKNVSSATKIALLLHLADTPHLLSQHDSVIDESIWKRAEDIAWYHLQESIRMLRSMLDNQDVVHASKILNWIKINGITEFTSSELSRSGPRPRLKVKGLRPVLDLLVECQYLANSELTTYYVNPNI